jgi:predicted MFS family arabinose efflux permease
VTDDRPATRLATRIAFFAAGFGAACWAPLAPFAKTRLRVDDAQLGLLLLCLGVGSLLAMPVTGTVGVRIGSRPMILLGGVGLGVVLPALAYAGSPPALALALLVFGASLGTIDVAMNAHAVQVEAAAGRSLMSGFHAMFSIGGFAGAGFMTLLLSLGFSPLWSALSSAVLILLAMVGAARGLLRTRQAAGEAVFARPRGVVLLIAGLAAVAFLVEGAMLDWGALLITGKGLATVAQGGLGFMSFSIAMTVGRLCGDAVVNRLGGRRTLIGSGLIAVAGFVVLLTAPNILVAMAGFLLIGLGASNVVPVLFSAAGRQKVMPPTLAIAAITTMAYAGVLAGPPLVGFVAEGIGLTGSFWVLAALMCLAPLLARAAVQDDQQGLHTQKPRRIDVDIR